MNQSPNPASSNLTIPLWAQLLVGLVIIGLIFVVGTRTSRFISSWDEESSNFYESVTEAMAIADINPSAPTIILFWEKDCEPCKRTLQVFSTLPPGTRYMGIHMADKAASPVEVHRTWAQYHLRPDALFADSSQMVQTSFGIKAVPQTYLLLPKQKKIYSYLGDLTKGRDEMLKLLSSN